MRFIAKIKIPNEPFNTLMREGTAGQQIGRCVEETSPESIYFAEMDGSRTAIAIYNLDKSSDLPRFAEPWFLSFDAKCEFSIAMTQEDLGRAGLDKLGKTWR